MAYTSKQVWRIEAPDGKRFEGWLRYDLRGKGGGGRIGRFMLFRIVPNPPKKKKQS
jgi:hypothetical protein